MICCACNDCWHCRLYVVRVILLMFGVADECLSALFILCLTAALLQVVTLFSLSCHPHQMEFGIKNRQNLGPPLLTCVLLIQNHGAHLSL